MFDNLPEREMNRYAELQGIIKALEIERSGLSTKIVEWLIDNQIKSIDLAGFRFTRTDRHFWDYPPEITDLENALKIARKGFEHNNPASTVRSFVTAKSLGE